MLTTNQRQHMLTIPAAAAGTWKLGGLVVG
jgi:hypothetical protein